MESEEWADGERRSLPIQNNDFGFTAAPRKPALADILAVIDKYRAKVVNAKSPAVASSFLAMLLMELLKFLPGLREIISVLLGLDLSLPEA